MKFRFSVWILLVSVCRVFGVGEPSVCANAVRWYDFSDPAYYTTDDAGHVLTAIDRSGKSNANVKTAGCFGQIVTFDGLPALDLGAVGSNIDYAFTQIGSNHTFFLVEALEASPGVFLIGASSSADFARGANGEYASTSSGNIGRTTVGVYDNCVRVDATATVIPAGRRLISIRYLKGTASGTIANFGTDSANKISGTETTCSGGKKVCEFLAFANEFTFDQCVEVENYLAAKWAIPTAVTASGALRAGSPSQYRTQSRGDVTFAAGTSLTFEKLDTTVVSFTVTGTLAFGEGLSQVPVTVDAASIVQPGVYPLLSWGTLAEGVEQDDFPLTMTNLLDTFVAEIVREENRLALKVAVADDWIYYNVGSGALTCESGKKYQLYGSGTQPVTVPANASVHLRFGGCTITTPANSAPVVIGAGAQVTADNLGTTTLTANPGLPGVALNENGASLHFLVGSGTFTATGGTKGGSGTGGAGIGTGVSDGGEDRTTGEFVINGGTVTARAGGNQGAGIGGAMAWKGKGGSLKSYVQTGGSVTAIGGTGVGGGGGGSQGAYEGGWCGPVKITGGTLVADSTAAPVCNYVGAAIGGGGCRHEGGKAGYLVSYEQTGGSVIARGKHVGIGGGGREPGNQNFLTYDTTVKISGGTLEATGSMWSIIYRTACSRQDVRPG